MPYDLSNSSVRWRRRSSTWFASNNPILGQAQQAYETDTKKVKIGDGVTAYNDLPYIDTDASDDGGAAYFVATVSGFTGSEVPFVANERNYGVLGRQILAGGEDGSFRIQFDKISDEQLVEFNACRSEEGPPLLVLYHVVLNDDGNGNTLVEVDVKNAAGNAVSTGSITFRLTVHP